MKSTAVFLLFSSFLVSCSSTTTINSTDRDAKIYIDGEYKGTGSATHTDTKIIGASTMVEIKKDGCEPKTYTFQRNEEFDVGACIGGVLVLFPFLWIQKYKPSRTYEYECRSGSNTQIDEGDEKTKILR